MRITYTAAPIAVGQAHIGFTSSMPLANAQMLLMMDVHSSLYNLHVYTSRETERNAGVMQRAHSSLQAS